MNISGTFAGVHFSQTTLDKLVQYNIDADIPNKVPADKMHCTLLYSRKELPTYQPLGKLDPPLIGKPMRLVKWPSQPDGDGIITLCLVLLFDCDDLHERHNQIMNEHGGTHSFSNYNPHVTLSYDVGNLQVSTLPDIRLMVDELEIVEEYKDTIDDNWAKKT